MNEQGKRKLGLNKKDYSGRGIFATPPIRQRSMDNYYYNNDFNYNNFQFNQINQNQNRNVSYAADEVENKSDVNFNFFAAAPSQSQQENIYYQYQQFTPAAFEFNQPEKVFYGGGQVDLPFQNSHLDLENYNHNDLNFQQAMNCNKFGYLPTQSTSVGTFSTQSLEQKLQNTTSPETHVANYGNHHIFSSGGYGTHQIHHQIGDHRHVMNTFESAEAVEEQKNGCDQNPKKFLHSRSLFLPSTKMSFMKMPQPKEVINNIKKTVGNLSYKLTKRNKLDKRSAVDRQAAEPKAWTKEEDELLRNAVEKYGASKWKEIAKMVPGRNDTQCLQRWGKVMKPGLKHGQWSKEEDMILLELATKAQEHLLLSLSSEEQLQCKTDKKFRRDKLKPAWGKISKQIDGRTAKQCRERWVNNLNPDIDRSEFSPEEDAKLIDLYKKYPKKWAFISRQLVGRTENAVKIRHKTLLSQQNISFNHQFNELNVNGENLEDPRRQFKEDKQVSNLSMLAETLKIQEVEPQNYYAKCSFDGPDGQGIFATPSYGLPNQLRPSLGRGDSNGSIISAGSFSALAVN